MGMGLNSQREGNHGVHGNASAKLGRCISMASQRVAEEGAMPCPNNGNNNLVSRATKPYSRPTPLGLHKSALTL